MRYFSAFLNYPKISCKVLGLTLFFTLNNLAKLSADSLSLPSVWLRYLRDSSAPFVLNNIDKKQISKHYHAQDLPYLLANLVPSMVAYSDAGTGIGQTNFRIRGTEANRSFISVNGAPLNDLESMAIYVGNIPDIASSATAIQVSRGIGALNAEVVSLGASLSIRTDELPNTQNYLSLSADYGSLNSMRNTLKFRSKAWKISNKDTIDLTLRLSQLHSDGYVERSMANYYSGYISLGYTHKNTRLNLIYFGGITRNLQAWAGVNFEDLQHNRRKNYLGLRSQSPPYNPRDYYTQHNLQLLSKFKITPRLLIYNTLYSVLGYGFYDIYQEKADLSKFFPNSTLSTGKFAELIKELWLKNILIGNTWNLRYHFGENIAKSTTPKYRQTLALGLSLQAYRAWHFSIANAENLPRKVYENFSPAQKIVFGTSLSWQYHLNSRLTFYTALQSRALSYTMPGNRKAPNLYLRKNYLFFNPSLGLTYIHKQNRIIASYTYSSREATRSDLVSSKGLARPENLHDLELQYEFRKEKLQVSNTFYVMYYRNQLVATGAVDDVGSFLQSNIRSSLRSGSETQIKAQIYQILQLRLMFSFAYNRLLKFGGANNLGILETRPLPFSPEIISSAFVDYSPLTNLTMSWKMQYVGQQFLNSEAKAKLSLPAYFLNSVYVSYKRNFKRKLADLALSCGVENLFNQAYSPNGYVYAEQAYYYPAMGRSYNLQLKMGFQW